MKPKEAIFTRFRRRECEFKAARLNLSARLFAPAVHLTNSADIATNLYAYDVSTTTARRRVGALHLNVTCLRVAIYGARFYYNFIEVSRRGVY